MADYRGMFDRNFIGAWDLEGRDVTLTISRVRAEKLTAQGGRTNRKPCIWFVGREEGKGFAVNKTNAKTIAGMYGNDTDGWVGKRITLYPTTTSMGSDTVDCIRVRPKIPVDERRARNGRQAQQTSKASEFAGTGTPADPENQDATPLADGDPDAEHLARIDRGEA